MEDFFAFRRMVTPVLIQVWFWLVAIGSVLIGLYVWSTQRNAALGLAIIVLGPLIARIWAEFLIVVFSIHASLNDIRTYFLRQPPPQWVTGVTPPTGPGAAGQSRGEGAVATATRLGYARLTAEEFSEPLLAEPRDGSTEVGSVLPGVRFEVLEHGAGFLRVQLPGGGRTGWLRRERVRVEEE